ncbi:GIY-YIG nuclease family protein [Nitrosomonas sp.]|uniref:GIY-YIG nuclease family protein n=1 Tax=Nitrosomonas sp. TaxID=42353 RepID=UPI00260AC637|nr:GIY-YIG nuclease family protein [Nitrosomonas sp.]MCW5601376.1 GIY-YIG nuclease family protein [Nitrosomonas sp.]
MQPHVMKFWLLNGVTDLDVTKNEYVIYGHYCKDGLYIGMTNDPVKRWQEHWSEAFNQHSRDYFHEFKAAIRENGSNFDHLILQVADTQNSAKIKEAEAIYYYAPSLNMKAEFNFSNDDFGYRPIDKQISKHIFLATRRENFGTWYSRSDDDRIGVIAEIYYDKGRKRLRTVEGQYYPAGLNIECSRSEREKFKNGDLVKVDVALSVKNGTHYLVAAKTAVLTPI